MTNVNPSQRKERKSAILLDLLQLSLLKKVETLIILSQEFPQDDININFKQDVCAFLMDYFNTT